MHPRGLFTTVVCLFYGTGWGITIFSKSIQHQNSVLHCTTLSIFPLVKSVILPPSSILHVLIFHGLPYHISKWNNQNNPYLSKVVSTHLSKTHLLKPLLTDCNQSWRLGWLWISLSRLDEHLISGETDGTRADSLVLKKKTPLVLLVPEPAAADICIYNLHLKQFFAKYSIRWFVGSAASTLKLVRWFQAQIEKYAQVKFDQFPM